MRLPLAIRSDFLNFFQRTNTYSFLSTFSVLPKFSQRTGREIFLSNPRIFSSTFKKQALIKFLRLTSYICYIENVLMVIYAPDKILTVEWRKPITSLIVIFVMYKLWLYSRQFLKAAWWKTIRLLKDSFEGPLLNNPW